MKHIIHVLLNEEYKGDDSQAKAVGKSLKAMLEASHSETELVEVLEEELNLGNTEDEKHYVVSAGEHGLVKVNDLKAAGINALFINSAHMYFDLMSSLPQLPDVLALPKGVLTEEQRESLNKKTRLVETFGVPHEVNEAALTIAKFDEQTDAFLAQREFTNIVGIMLAGDAPDGAEMRYFTPDEAKEKAALVYQSTKEHYQKSDKSLDENTLFVVTNGPRTGKHDYEEKTLLEPNPHKTEDTVDAVSFAFIHALRQLMETDGLNPAQLLFQDFKYGQPSAYHPMLRILIDREGLYFVPSESTSMVTEASYPASQGVTVIAYRPGSENPSHTAHLEQCYDMGVLAILDSNAELKEKKLSESSDLVEATADIIRAVQAQIAISHMTRQNSILKQKGSPKKEQHVRFYGISSTENEKDETRRKEMSKDTPNPALEDGQSTVQASSNSDADKNVLQKAYDKLPAMPEGVKKHMTWQNAGYAAAGTLALVGLFAAGRAGYIPNPLASVPEPKGPSR